MLDQTAMYDQLHSQLHRQLEEILREMEDNLLPLTPTAVAVLSFEMRQTDGYGLLINTQAEVSLTPEMKHDESGEHFTGFWDDFGRIAHRVVGTLSKGDPAKYRKNSSDVETFAQRLDRKSPIRQDNVPPSKVDKMSEFIEAAEDEMPEWLRNLQSSAGTTQKYTMMKLIMSLEDAIQEIRNMGFTQLSQFEEVTGTVAAGLKGFYVPTDASSSHPGLSGEIDECMVVVWELINNRAFTKQVKGYKNKYTGLVYVETNLLH